MKGNVKRRKEEIQAIRRVKKGKYNSTKYSFKFSPYKHQEKGFHFMHAAPRLAIHGDCGTGKTAIAASFSESLIEAGEGGPILVVCPISIIVQSWLKDIEKFTNLKAISIYEPSSYKRKEKREKRLATDADIYIASFSLILLMEKELRKKKFRTIIVDESTKIKNPRSKTFRALLEVAWKADRRYVMSGTPAPNGPIDLWSQFFFIDGGQTLEPSFVDFRNKFYNRIEIGGGKEFWTPKRHAPAEVNKLIEPVSIRFRASECLDLPKQVFVTRECPMSKEQARVYKDMAEDLFVQLESGEPVTARVAISRLMKLREVTGGFIIDDSGEPHQVGSNPKMSDLDDLLEQALSSGEHKALIWIQYRWEAREILKKYKKKYGARGLYGDIPQKDKDKNIDSFLSEDACRILVCHPQSAAHGLTLTVANYSIYYSLSYNFEEYYQSSKRVHRPGQKKTSFYYFLTCPDTIDETLLSCIQDKKNVQDVIVDGKTSAESILGLQGDKK